MDDTAPLGRPRCLGRPRLPLIRSPPAVIQEPPPAEASTTPRPPGPAAGGAPDFRALFEAHLAFVWNSLRLLGVRDGDLEDVTHEVFLIVHRRLDRYDPTRSLKAWIFAIASHAASDYRRLARHRREVLGDDAPERSDDAPSAEERLSARQEGRLVREALNSLEPERRTVLALHDIEGLPVPEIAAALEIPLNTAYSRLRLARRDLVAALTRLRRRQGE